MTSLPTKAILCDLVTHITPLVNLIQDYDMDVFVANLLDHWSPRSLTWPDSTKNPQVSRHLLTYHFTDVVVPYLDALLRHIAQMTYGDSGGYCLWKAERTPPLISISINVVDTRGNNNKHVLSQVLPRIHQETTHVIIFTDDDYPLSAFKPLFATCPLFETTMDADALFLQCYHEDLLNTN